MKALIIVYPGTNRERDMAAALTRAGAVVETVWHTERELPKADLIVLPGGFSYGDYLRSGAIAARSPATATIVERANAGVPVLGVCNGFQTLVECGLLPGALMRNAKLKFICRDVHLKVENTRCLFTNQYEADQVIRVPVAHHDGNYFADPATLDRLEGDGRVAFRYCDEAGSLTKEANINGSQRSIAGILNQTGTVLGMMPHPENLTDPILGGTDGCGLFESMAAAA